MELKADGEPGEFRAVFATLNVVDHDMDKTIPGAFMEQEVVVEPWNHGWTLPAGMGKIQANENEAWIEGKFFLDTEVGKENYQTVKNLGPLAEWSYTFDILKSSWLDPPEEDGTDRILEKLDVVGVSPVTRGAGINTRTTTIKEKKDGSDPSSSPPPTGRGGNPDGDGQNEGETGEAGEDSGGNDGKPSDVDLNTRIDLAEMAIIMLETEE